MKKILSVALFWGLFFGILIGILIIFFAENIIQIAYKEDGFLMQFISIFYPRFLTEKHRFPIDFFVQKIQQMGFRFVIFGMLGLFFFYFFPKIKNNFKPIFIQKTHILWLQRYFCVFLLWCVWDWYWILGNLSEMDFFYQPVFLLRFFGKNNFSFTFLMLVYGALIGSILCILFNQKPFEFSIILFLSFIFLQGYLYSFHKIDHTFAPVNYVSFLWIFLFWEEKNVFGEDTKHGESYALLLMQIAVAMCYTLAGIEKLLTSGFYWLIDAPLQYYLLASETPLGMWLGQYFWICWFFGVVVLFWEILFIWAIFQQKNIVFLWLFGGFLFHLGTFILMNVGGFPHTWVCLYVVYLKFKGLKVQRFKSSKV